MPVVVSALSALPLLSHLPQVTVAHLAQHAQVTAYAKREVVLHKGAAGQCLNFLLDGRLQGLDLRRMRVRWGCTLCSRAIFLVRWRWWTTSRSQST